MGGCARAIDGCSNRRARGSHVRFFIAKVRQVRQRSGWLCCCVAAFAVLLSLPLPARQGKGTLAPLANWTLAD